MKKSFLALLLLVLILPISQLSAQQKKTTSSKSSSGKSSTGGSAGSGYQTAIGLRGGNYASGLTIKHFLSSGKNVAVEGLVTTEYLARGARFTLLFEKHWQIIPEAKNLQWYVGGGLHAGAYRGRYYYDVEYRYKKKGYYYYREYYYDNELRPAVGGDLVVGVEYKIPDLPLVIGVDYKPYFEIYDWRGTGFYNDAALSIRFAF